VRREVWSAVVELWGEDQMADAGPTLGYLIRRFQLRRRASTEEFAAGVRLARTGQVRLADVKAHEAAATVRDGGAVSVRLTVEGVALEGACSGEACRAVVCRHQVATAHALWVLDRRGPRIS
jgi:uncharacterized Zn finger protein